MAIKSKSFDAWLSTRKHDFYLLEKSVWSNASSIYSKDENLVDVAIDDCLYVVENVFKSVCMCRCNDEEKHEYKR